MIAKVPKKRADGRSTFASLIAYIAKSAASIVCGDAVFSLETAASEMRFVAGANQRCKDPVYHYVLSWPQDENPSDEQAHDAIRATLAELGMLDRQWVGAVHRNTIHAHVHVAVNRVHPTTFRVASPRRDWLTLDRTCRVLELKHGWSHDRGPYVVSVDQGEVVVTRERPSLAGPTTPETSSAKDFSAWTGLKSFQKWVGGEPARHLRQALADGQATWQTVHEALALFGLEYRMKGSGAIVVDRDRPDKYCAKASHLGRFASRSRLESTLGPYVLPRQDHSRSAYDRVVRKPKHANAHSYQQTPARPAIETQKRFRADPLYERYQLETSLWRSSGLPRHRNAWKEQLERERSRRESVRQSRQRIRSLIRRVAAPRLRRTLYLYEAWVGAAMRQEAGVQAASERSLLRARRDRESPGSWTQWLVRQADAGDELAKRRLRLRRLRERRAADSKQLEPVGLLSSTSAPRLVQLDKYRVIVRSDGLDYSVDGRIAFRDTGRRVAVFEAGDDALVACMLLSREKWGRTLTADGSSKFKERVARLGGELGLEIRVGGDHPLQALNAAPSDPQDMMMECERLSRELRKPTVYCEAETHGQYTGNVLSISSARDGEDVLVLLDLGRTLGIFRTDRLAVSSLELGRRVVAQTRAPLRRDSQSWRFHALERTRSSSELELT